MKCASPHKLDDNRGEFPVLRLDSSSSSCLELAFTSSSLVKVYVWGISFI